MTPEREAEIRARLAGATPGPWKYEWESAGESDNFTASIYEDDYKGLLVGRCNQNGSHHGDEEFIANAPADVAELLDEVDRLRAALRTSTERLANTLDELRATLERAREGCR